MRLTLLDRTDPDYTPISHLHMPTILSGFEYFLDFKGHGKELYALSRTAIEAIACGCKVIHDSDLDKEITEYTFVHPESYLDMYSWLMPPSRAKRMQRYGRLMLSGFKWLLGRIK